MLSIPPNHNVVAGVWSTAPGTRLRIAFGHDASEMRAFMWIQVSKDGSIYMGPRNPNYSYAKIGEQKIQDGKVHIRYEDGTEITDPDAVKERKVSFHASGTIHSGGVRSFRSTLRGITKRQLLCHMLFQEPEKYPILPKIGKHDICLRYPFNLDAPLVCNTYVAPAALMFPPLEISDAEFQYSVILRYDALKDIGDFVVQLLFYHNSKGPWPPASYIVWPGTLDKSKG